MSNFYDIMFFLFFINYLIADSSGITNFNNNKKKK